MDQIKYTSADSSGWQSPDTDYQISFDFAKPDETFSIDIGDWNLEEDIDYAFNEGELLKQMKKYIDSTYDAHYSQGKYQATQIIEDCGHGMGFALGNVLKYAQRYGKKEGLNRADLLKVVHYGIIALAMHDRASD